MNNEINNTRLVGMKIAKAIKDNVCSFDSIDTIIGWTSGHRNPCDAGEICGLVSPLLEDESQSQSQSQEVDINYIQCEW